MSEGLDKIKESILKSVNNFGEDKEIEDKSTLISYFNLVTENLRENNKKITRNSFWLILSVLLYVLILFNNEAISEIKILFTSIKDNNLLLNVIPVFFSFIYFQNTAIWNHNMNLWHLFKKLSNKLFLIGYKTDTSHIIRPFSLIQHFSYYQLSNKKIKGLFKLPTTLSFIVFSLFPLGFEIYSVYNIAKNNYPNFIPITCATLVILLFYLTIVQFINHSKNK